MPLSRNKTIVIWSPKEALSTTRSLNLALEQLDKDNSITYRRSNRDFPELLSIIGIVTSNNWWNSAIVCFLIACWQVYGLYHTQKGSLGTRRTWNTLLVLKNIFIKKVSPRSIHVLRSSYLYPFTSLRPMLSNYHSSLIPQNLVCEIVTFPSNGEKRYMVGENCSLISMSVKFNVKHLKSICSIFIIRRCRQWRTWGDWTRILQPSIPMRVN